MANNEYGVGPMMLIIPLLEAYQKLPLDEKLKELEDVMDAIDKEIEEDGCA